MTFLSTRHKDIIRLRSLGWTFKKIGEYYNISHERARQLHVQALRLQGQAALVQQFPSLKGYYP